MLRNRLMFLLLLVGALGCDNVGRAFDRDLNPDDPDTEAGVSSVQVVPVGGTAEEGRPRVRASYPEGAGWPTTVPVVVEFSESVNADSLLPTTPTGLDARIGVRLLGTNQLLPMQYDLIAEGRLLIMRPLQPFTDNNGTAIYEIVLFAEARDVDGVRFQVSDGEEILGDFQVNQAESITDGRILAVFPRDNNRELQREGDVFVVFDRPANAGTLVDANIAVAPRAGTAVAATIATPLSTVGVSDARVVRIRPTAPLAGATVHELTVTSNITFGQDGNLDFNGATPFSEFTTVAPAAPTNVELGNPTASAFANKINQGNVLTPMLSVTPPADALAGDRVVARIYGGDAETAQQTFDLDFLEVEVTLAADGATPVTLDFSGLLGTIAGPKFDDGEVFFAARMVRGGEASGFIQDDDASEPRFDVTPPTLVTAGPPVSADGTTLFTDQESLAFYGSASEEIAEANLTVGAETATLYASASDGRFVMLPVILGRQLAAVPYSLTLTDSAGNAQITASTGNVVQYGLLTGTLAGSLTVHAFDQATLLPIEGATVLVDPDTPMMPAVGRQVEVTNADGRATFATASSAHTITIVRAGYDLVTLYDTQSQTVSLPLSPIGDATATQRGTAVFAPAAGTTAIVSNSAATAGGGLGVRTTNAAPNVIPDIEILPNRPQLVTGFGGSIEPTASPGFAIEGCAMCGPTLLMPTAPVAPAEPGSTVETTLALIDPGVTLLTTGVHTEDFASAIGLDTANLVTGDPIVRVTASFLGFSGQVLMGVGYIDGNTGASYDVQANFSLPIFTALNGFLPTPVGWLALEGEDTAGRISRTRSVLIAGTGQVLDDTDPPAIPVISAPSTTPFIGSPEVTVVDPIDVADFAGAFGYLELTATDAAGRQWHLLVVDRDGSGGSDTVQFPDLASSSVVGLAAGDWQMLAEARQAFTLGATSIDDIVLAERLRSEVNYSRGLPVTFTIQ